MRRGIVLAALALSVWLPAPAQSEPCAVHATLSLHGEIIIPPVIDGDEWFWPGKFAHQPCRVMTLRGKGALPPECAVGKRMTVTGRVIEDGVLILEVARIRCY